MSPTASVKVRGHGWVALAAVLLLGACSPSGKQNARALGNDANRAARDTARAIAAAVQATWASIRDYTMEKRPEFEARVHAMTAALDEKVNRIRSQAPDADPAFAGQRSAALEDYRSARAEMDARLSELSGASAGTWTSAKDGTDKAWIRMKAAYDRLVVGQDQADADPR
jgi:hypothetical protein